MSPRDALSALVGEPTVDVIADLSDGAAVILTLGELLIAAPAQWLAVKRLSGHLADAAVTERALSAAEDDLEVAEAQRVSRAGGLSAAEHEAIHGHAPRVRTDS